MLTASFRTSKIRPRCTSLIKRMLAVDFPKLFCFGDSLTQRSFDVDEGCWGALLASRYQRKIDVLNRGFSAYNSRQGVFLLPRLLPVGCNAPYAMLIWFGANDCCVPGAPPHVSLENYGANLKIIINHATNIGIPLERLILLTPPKYNHEAWAAHKAEVGIPEEQVGRCENLCELYAERCLSVAKKMGTKFVDVCGAMRAELDWQSLLIDGLHFNRKGAQFVASLLEPVLDPIIEKVPLIFPNGEQIDFEDSHTQIHGWKS